MIRWLKSGIYVFRAFIGVSMVWGMVQGSSLYAAEHTVQDFRLFVHEGENIFLNTDGSLEYHPRMDESPDKALTYHFSPVPRQGVKTSGLTVTDKRLTEEGYFGTGLSFTATSEPFVLPAPDFLKQYPVYSWGMTFYFYPVGLSENSVLLSSTRTIWKDIKGQPESEPYQERWSLTLVNETLVTELDNLFHLEGKQISARLESSVPIELHNWNKLELSYNVQTGELEQWLNGRFSARTTVQKQVSDGQTGSEPNFYYFGFAPEQLEAPLVFTLGENFNGRLDELSFYRAPLSSALPPALPPSVLTDRTAFFTSKWSSQVFRLKPFTQIRRVMLTGTEKGIKPLKIQQINQATDLYVCSSPDYFPEQTFRSLNSSEVSKEVSCVKGWLGQDLPILEEGFFYQLFFVSKNRSYPYPQFTELKIVYDIDEPPLTPILTDQKSFSDSILLYFRAGLEDDVLGYTLTYRSEVDTTLQKIRIPLAELTALKRNPFEYTYLLEGLETGLLYILELRSYDKIIEGKERVSLRGAQTFVLTKVASNSF